MKRILPLGAALVSVAFLSNVVHAGLAQSGTVGVGAVVGESPSTLEVKVLDIASGDVVPNVNFGTPSNAVAEWSTLAPHVVQIKVVNSNNWELKTYTDNFKGLTPPTVDKWGYQYGGMIDAAKTGKKAGMGWTVRETRDAVITTGNPADGRLPLDPTLPFSKDNWKAGGNGFTYLKDRSDMDTPEPDGKPETVDTDQSFHYTSGYINIAYGGYGITTLVRPELKTAIVEWKDAKAQDPFYYFVEGNFSGASAATYETTINFDLVNL